jgi:ubiquinone/menaquinone biosynthesis C-methylase UbiE
MARIYHARGLTWPGELDFYLELAAKCSEKGQPILEIACGTGRVASQLARAGARVTGFDLSLSMLDVARLENTDIPNSRWLKADMRDFKLNESFGLIISPGHSFMHMITISDQLACLACLRRHLDSNGLLVLHIDHQDMPWLGDLRRDLGGVYKPGEQVIDPHTGHLVCTQRAWWYQPVTQTATAVTRWEEFDAAGESLDRWETGPNRFHCFFRYELEHLLQRAGFQVEALFGDFYRGELSDTSTEMIWLARVASAPE